MLETIPDVVNLNTLGLSKLCRSFFKGAFQKIKTSKSHSILGGNQGGDGGEAY